MNKRGQYIEMGGQVLTLALDIGRKLTGPAKAASDVKAAAIGLGVIAILEFRRAFGMRDSTSIADVLGEQ